MIFMYARYWKIYSLSVRKFGFSVQFHKQFLVDSYVHRRRDGCTEFRYWSIKSNWWHWKDSKSDRCFQVKSSRSGLANMARHISRSDGNIGEENMHNILSENQFADAWRSRSIAADVNNEGESLKIAKWKSKPTQWWVQYHLDELQKKHSSYNKKIIRKFSTIEGLMYSLKNIETIRDQMQQLDDIFKAMLDVQKEYNSLLPAEEEPKKEVKNGLMKLIITSALFWRENQILFKNIKQ